MNVLISNKHFDGIDMMSFVGWKQGKNVPAMADVYTELHESGWTRYIKKLCKVIP